MRKVDWVWAAVICAAVAGGYAAGLSRDEPSSRVSSPTPTGKEVETQPAPTLHPTESDAAETQHSGSAESESDPALDRVVDAMREALGEEPSQEHVEAARHHLDFLKNHARNILETAEETTVKVVLRAFERKRSFLRQSTDGDPIAMLRALPRNAHPFELLGDYERFAAHFERKLGGPTISMTDQGPDGAIEDGAVIVFPEGVFRRSLRGLVAMSPFPKELVIEGAGKDRTLAEIDLLVREPAVLTLREMTVLCRRGRGLARIQREPAAIRLDNCRVVGFDIGTGSSSMVSGLRVAVLATSCEFIAGYGRAPGSGNLFRIRTGLVRVDESLIRGPFKSVFDNKGTYVFSGCVFENTPDYSKDAPKNVRFVNCVFSKSEEQVPQGVLPLSRLNPAWE